MKNRFLVVVCFVLFGQVLSFGQDSYSRLDYPNGYPVRLKTPEDVQGTPFLFETWQEADLLLKDSTVFSHVKTRLNLYNNKLYFLKDDQELECVSPVWQFTLVSPVSDGSKFMVFRNGYPAIDKNTETTYYQLLADGKFQLIKRVFKYLDERGGYSGPKEKVYQKDEALYAYLPGNKIIRLNKYKEDLLAAAPDYQSQITKIESTLKLKLRKTDDLIRLFNALNSE